MSDIRPRAVRAHGDKLLADHTLVITLRGTDKPYCKIKPEYTQELGPHISIYRMLIDGSEERCLTLGSGAVSSILRWLPMVMSAARRLENSASKPPKAKKRG